MCVRESSLVEYTNCDTVIVNVVKTWWCQILYFVYELYCACISQVSLVLYLSQTERLVIVSNDYGSP